MALWTGLVLSLKGKLASAQTECDAERAGLSMLQAHLAKERNVDRSRYHWASGRGNFPNYSVSPHPAPFKVGGSLAWKWHHPLGRFATLTFGTAIDADSNIYLSAADGIRKFDPHGVTLWEYSTLPAWVYNAPALYDGMVHSSDTDGYVFASCLS